MSGSTLVDLLRSRADRQFGYTFVDLHGDARQYTFQELDRQARAVGAALTARGMDRQRVLLLYPPGLDYVTAFFGCLYAGAVAVPVFPPNPARLDRTLPRLTAVAADAEPAAVLTTSDTIELAQAVLAIPAERWLATDTIPSGHADDWISPDVGPADVALIQYTSGSTATPKGVLLDHRNLLHNSSLIQECFGTSTGSRGLSWLPLYHDMGLIGGVLQPLHADFPMVLMSPLNFLSRPMSWLREVSRYGVTASGGPNFAYDLCVRKFDPQECQGLDLSRWQVAFNGAEPVRPDTLDRFAETFAPYGFDRSAFLPCYGLAEATLIVTGTPVTRPPRVLSVDAEALAAGRAEPATDGRTARLTSSGPPLGRQGVIVADPEDGTPCPDETVGEICVRGPSVSRGYWRRPDQTSETFGPNGLRTGDLGFMHDGELFVTGRRKDLIIVRGRNIYPQDVELAATGADARVRQGCAVAFGVPVGAEEQVVVVAELAPGTAAEAATDVAGRVREAVGETQEIPVHRVVMIKAGSMPKTSSGKLQRSACRDSFLDGTLEALGSSGTPREPDIVEVDGDLVRAVHGRRRTELVRDYLRRRFAAAVGCDPALVPDGRRIDELGLDSLASVELLHRIEQDLRLSLPLYTLLGPRSVDELGRLVERLLDDEDRHDDDDDDLPVAGAPPLLTEGQQALWFLAQLNPAADAYHLVRAFTVTPGRHGETLDVDGLDRALTMLVTRHEALRTVLPERDGQPDPRVVDPPGHVLHRHPVPDADLDDEVRRVAAEPFDLARGPLFRAVLLEPTTRLPVLVVAAHHVVMDLWSAAVLIRELRVAYRRLAQGQPVELPPVPCGAARRLAAARQKRQAHLSHYWRDRLAGEPPVLTLPDTRPRPPLQTSRGAVLRHQLPPALGDGVARLAAASRTTPFVVLLSALQLLLSRYTGERDIVVGTPVATRRQPGLAAAVGYFLNTLVLRGDLSGDPSFTELLARNRHSVDEAIEHQDHPFPLLVEELITNRDPSRTPLFQVMLAYESAPGGETIGALALNEAGTEVDLGVRLVGRPLPRHTATFDLTLRVADTSAGLATAWEYNTDVLTAETVTQLAGHLEVLLTEVSARPTRRLGALTLFTPEQQARQRRWNDTTALAPTGRCMHELIVATARRDPSAIAVQTSRTRLSYGALVTRASTLAAHLHAQGVGPEVRVGVFLRRSPEAIASILAVLMAGGAYVPLDPDAPRLRIAHILSDARPAVVVTDADVAELLPAVGVPTVRIDQAMPAVLPPTQTGVRPDNLAYVMYTSGSTGRPKGILVSHANLVTSTHARLAYFPDRIRSFLLISSLAFDSSLAGLFWTLYEGGSLILPDQHRQQDPAHHRELLARYEVSHFESVPSLYLSMLRQLRPDGLPELRSVVVAGEACAREVYEQHRTLLPHARLVNEYGPTEATVWCSAYRAGPRLDRPHLPIGRPIANATLYLLDRDGQPTPDGAVGEIHIGGAGVARGYHDNPAPTAERFLPDPFSNMPGARMYRTGDLARMLPDGELEFVGRVDRQLKIRGVRIELAEIEAALHACDGVAEAAVRPAVDPQGDTALVAYLVPADDEGPSDQRIRAELMDRLPTAMVPARFVRLPAMPLTTHGKVDDDALPPVEWTVPTDATGSADPVAQLLCDIYADLLQRPRFGVDEDFFAAGGHSLLVTQVVSRIRATFGVEVPAGLVFSSPTVRQVAAEVRAALNGSGPTPQSAPIVAGTPRPAPLSYTQQRLWFIDRLLPGNPAYHIPVAVRLRGPLDRPALHASLEAVVCRHETLRTTVEQTVDGPVQRVHPPTPLALDIVDISSEEALQAEMSAAARRPFDLATGPLLRATLYARSDEDHVLLLVTHHILADGWSLAVLTDEVTRGYDARVRRRPDPVDHPPVQYGDYATWQREQLRPELMRSQLDGWAARLADAPMLRLPTDHPRPVVQRFVGDTRPWHLDAETTATLKDRAREADATLFMLLLAAFGLVLGRRSYATDLVLGTPVSGRTHLETERLIGFFANTLALRLDLSGDPSFADLTARVRDVCLDAYLHQDVPFELLVEALQPTRDLGRNPLFQVVFALQNAPRPTPRLAGLDVELLEVGTGTAKFDLTVSVWETDSRLSGTFEYSADLFEPATVDAIAADFTRLLRSVAADPRRPLPHLVDGAAIRTMGGDGPPPTPLPELVKRQTAARPEAPAVSTGTIRLTYGELRARADSMAADLRRRGAGPATPVGVAARSVPDRLAAVVAILDLGAICVLLSPDGESVSPEESGGTGLLLTDDGVREGWVRTATVTEGTAGCVADCPRTGVPVATSHSALPVRVSAVRDALRMTVGDRVLTHAPPEAEAALWEQLAGLTAGAEIVVPDDGEPLRSAAERLAATVVVVATEDVAGLTGAPARLRVLCIGVQPPRSPEFAGEVAFQPEEPAGATVWTRYPDGTWRGGPHPGHRVRVVDRFGGAVEVGIPGQLHLFTPTLDRTAPGHPDDRGAAGSADVDDRPADPDRPEGHWMPTGTLVRYRRDGTLEWLGPVDPPEDDIDLSVTPFVAPRDSVERVVATVWAELLDRQRVGVHDDFFEAGGHSLLAMQVISRLAAIFQVEVPIQTYFEEPTVAGLAASLTHLQPRPGQTEQIALIWERVRAARCTADAVPTPEATRG